MGSPDAGAYVVDLADRRASCTRATRTARSRPPQREAADHRRRAAAARAATRRSTTVGARRRTPCCSPTARWRRPDPRRRRRSLRSTTSRCATSSPSCGRAGDQARHRRRSSATSRCFDTGAARYDSSFGYDSDLGGELGALTVGPRPLRLARPRVRRRGAPALLPQARQGRASTLEGQPCRRRDDRDARRSPVHRRRRRSPS